MESVYKVCFSLKWNFKSDASFVVSLSNGLGFNVLYKESFFVDDEMKFIIEAI